MGDLLIRDIPDDMKRDLSEIAKLAGRSMSEEAKAMLRREIASRKALETPQPGKNALEELRNLFAPTSEEDEQFSKIMNEIEAERKTDFGRPFSFEE